MQASRLLSILILLQVRKRVSAEALAQEFEVSVRTIYRDIDQLSAAGVPVYSERGRSGGFSLHADYRTQLTGMTQGEADALMLAGAGRAASALGFGPKLAEARLKLLASLPPETAHQAERAAARFHLDPASWSAPGGAPRWLPELASAVWADRRIEIGYQSWTANVERKLDPLGLVLKAGSWYLVARQGKDVRTYRAANISQLSVLDEVFQRPLKFDLARFWDASAKAFEAGRKSSAATIAVSPLGLTWLKDIHPRAADVFLREGAAYGVEGWLKAQLDVEESRFARLQWLALGTEARILAPLRLQKLVRDEALAVAQAGRH